MNTPEKREKLKKYFKQEGLSQIKIANILGISQPAVGALLNGKTPFGKKTAAMWSEKFGLNASWLLIGEGEMLKGNSKGKVDEHLKQGKVIRYWADLEATGGGIMSFDDSIKGGYSEIIIPDFNDCTDAMRIVGDSMYPRYKSGQIIIFKEWNESFIEFGQVYLIITKTGYRMIKYLQPSEENDKLICVSENKEQFPPFTIEIDSIHRLYLVKGSIEQNTY